MDSTGPGHDRRSDRKRQSSAAIFSVCRSFVCKWDISIRRTLKTTPRGRLPRLPLARSIHWTGASPCLSEGDISAALDFAITPADIQLQYEDSQRHVIGACHRGRPTDPRSCFSVRLPPHDPPTMVKSRNLMNSTAQVTSGWLEQPRCSLSRNAPQQSQTARQPGQFL